MTFKEFSAGASIILAAALLAAAPAQAGVPEIQAKADELFSPYAASAQPGCAVGLFEKGRTVFSRAYGVADMATGAPLTADTVFYAASNSKQFTAMAIAKLVEESKVGLKDDVRRWIPELPDYGAPITVEMMIHHTSGLGDFLGDFAQAGMSDYQALDRKAVLEMIARQKTLSFAPGTQYRYSNSGYFLLAEIVERASGQSFADFTRTRILEPAGMRKSWFRGGPPAKGAVVAHGYVKGAAGYTVTDTYPAFSGSGGLMTSITGLRAFDDDFHSRHRAWTAATRARLLEPGRYANGDVVVRGPGRAYAGGLQVGKFRDHDWVGHAGGHAAFKSFYVRLPDLKLGLALLCNRGDVDPLAVHDQLLDAYLGTTPPAQASTAAEIDRAVQASIAAKESPGLQVAVYKDGAPVLVKGYGWANLELEVPVSDDSVFRIGSITKQFTAVAILKLAEDGKLSLDDRLSKFYPDYPRAKDITLAQLLHHTSGLFSYTGLPTRTADGMVRRTSAEMVAYLSAMPQAQAFEPGTDWRYSNTGYVLLGAVIEKVSGQSVGAFFKARLFDPLGMTRTAYDDETEIVPGRASGYELVAPGQFANATYISLTFPGAAGSLRSTAEDLARWNAALFGGKVLKPASFAAMTTPGRLNDGRPSSAAMIARRPQTANPGEYGLGVRMITEHGHRKVEHGGGIPGFSSQLTEFPDDRITVVVLSNAIGEDVGAGKIAERIERIVLEMPER